MACWPPTVATRVARRWSSPCAWRRSGAQPVVLAEYSALDSTKVPTGMQKCQPSQGLMRSFFRSQLNLCSPVMGALSTSAGVAGSVRQLLSVQQRSLLLLGDKLAVGTALKARGAPPAGTPACAGVVSAGPWGRWGLSRGASSSEDVPSCDSHGSRGRSSWSRSV